MRTSHPCSGTPGTVIGALTRISYESSTAFAIADGGHADTRWRTVLPFPVPVVATVERIVPNLDIAASPERTIVRGALVVAAPWGAHPGGVSGRYVPDLAHYREYAAAGEARRRDDPVPYQAYLERHVFGLARS